jgi:hypothetical protein
MYSQVQLIVTCCLKRLSSHLCTKPSTARQPWPREHVKCSASRICRRKCTKKIIMGNKRRKCVKVQQQTLLVKCTVWPYSHNIIHPFCDNIGLRSGMPKYKTKTVCFTRVASKSFFRLTQYHFLFTLYRRRADRFI